MITEQAIVKRCQGGQVELELERQSACGKCELNQGCGTGALGRLLGRRGKPLVIDNNHDLKTGDSVVLSLSEQVLVRASLLVYGLPLAGMVLGAVFAALLTTGEWLVLLAAAAGFAVGFKLASRLVNSSVRTHLIPAIVGIQVNPDSDSQS